MVASAVVGAAFTGSVGQHRAAQQRRSGIEAATGVTDHPASIPPACLPGLPLRFHLQGHTGQLVATIAQLIPVMALQHKEAVAAMEKPTAWQGNLAQFIELELGQQVAAAGLAEFDAQGLQGFTSPASPLTRLEKPQRKRPATSSSRVHSGGTSWGSPRRRSSRRPTSPTAR